MRTIMTMATVLLLAACGGDKDKKSEDTKEAPAGETEPAAGETPAADKKVAEPAPAAAGGVDQSDPKAVVTALFEAAKSGDTSKLATLCHPDVDSDGDARSMCAMTKDDGKWAEFQEYFKDGSVSGEPTIEGDTARVEFKFGPGGSETETMKLARKDGNWYLASF